MSLLQIEFVNALLSAGNKSNYCNAQSSTFSSIAFKALFTEVRYEKSEHQCRRKSAAFEDQTLEQGRAQEIFSKDIVTPILS